MPWTLEAETPRRSTTEWQKLRLLRCQRITSTSSRQHIDVDEGRRRGSWCERDRIMPRAESISYLHTTTCFLRSDWICSSNCDVSEDYARSHPRCDENRAVVSRVRSLICVGNCILELSVRVVAATHFELCRQHPPERTAIAVTAFQIPSRSEHNLILQAPRNSWNPESMQRGSEVTLLIQSLAYKDLSAGPKPWLAPRRLNRTWETDCIPSSLRRVGRRYLYVEERRGKKSRLVSPHRYQVIPPETLASLQALALTSGECYLGL